MADLQNEELQKLEELLQDENYQPSRKELLELLQSSEMDEEMKESLKSMLAGDLPQFFGGHGVGTYLAVTFVVIMFLIISEYINAVLV
ncbi:jg17109 [Pararge aegeria aegeria]|uniref:Jg17109 protein n=1 Tax=Pararge aegeria aegeria TaxID=348720 RepID=A0A8S4R2B3_9NEOP|nr:jg17109 [Pararge aegeria aegeria]